MMKKITILIIAIALVAAGWWFFNYERHKGLFKLNVVVLPSDSKLTIDGKATKPGKVYITSGTHNLKATRTDFEDVSKTVNTSQITPGGTIYLMPNPKSDAALKWLSEHPDVQSKREAVGALETQKQTANQEQKYPIIKSLPYENLDYKIDYSITADNKLEFTITLYAIINRPSQHDQYVQQLHQYKTEALNYLSSNGVNPQDYKITYIPSVE